MAQRNQRALTSVGQGPPDTAAEPGDDERRVVGVPSALHGARDVDRLRVTMVSEGGYPYAGGGVSVWCDQLIRAMPEHLFEVVALTAARGDVPVFDLPHNVVSLRPVPLWSACGRRRGLRGRSRTHFRETYTRLLSSTLGARPSREEFDDALRALYEFAQMDDLSSALSSDDAVHALSDTWRATPPGSGDPGAVGTITPSLGEVALVTVWFEHMLRPLSLRAAEADLVHCASNGLVGLVALGAKWSHATPFVVSEHGVYLRERYLAHRQASYGWAVKSALLRLTRSVAEAVYAEADIVVPGNVYNRRWQERGGADPDAIVTVYNGVDPEDFVPGAAAPDVPTLVYVGRIDPIKDLETLIRAFALVTARLPEARLRIFGVAQDRDYLARCADLVAELGLGGSVAFEGRAASAREAYQSGHVVVLSSISEGFPYTVIEAMSCGLPTVSTDVGGVAEAVGHTGLVVPARDPRAFAEACVALLLDPGERDRCGRAARARVLELFTLEGSMSSFRAIYAGLVGEQPSARVDAPGRARSRSVVSA